jgi:hypothetical protein
MLKKQGGRVWIGFIWLYGPVAETCEYGNELSGPIKGEDVLNK